MEGDLPNRLAFSGPRNDRLPNESLEGYYRRTSRNWGLMEWCAHSCELFKVDKLLIEASEIAGGTEADRCCVLQLAFVVAAALPFAAHRGLSP
jgi:hypothetical protein